MKVILAVLVLCFLGLVYAQEQQRDAAADGEDSGGWSWFQSDSADTRPRKRARSGATAAARQSTQSSMATNLLVTINHCYTYCYFSVFPHYFPFRLVLICFVLLL